MKFTKSEEKSVNECVSVLKKGGVVIIPTDTVYGFSGIVDVKNKDPFFTDSKIRQIKGREESKPMIHLISKPEDIYLYTDDKLPDVVLEKWPGALTVIVHLKKDSPLNTNLQTVAFRCPGDKWIRSIIEKCGAPLYSTSVNRSGSPVLDEFATIEKEFCSEVDLLIDDGNKKGAMPSTLISIENGNIKVLRQGSVTF